MHKYFVEKNEFQTPSTLLLSLKKDSKNSRPFLYQPGQYAAISFRRHGRPTPARCFSIVSSPAQPGILQFSMRARGRFTKALAQLKPDDEVVVRGPYGGFVLDLKRDANTVMIAGGIGITPFMSMIRFAASGELPNKITLLISSQNQDDVPFAEELKHLEKTNPNLTVYFVIGSGEITKFSDSKVINGRISAEVLDHAASGDFFNKSFLICGPPPFMKSIVSMLQAKKVASSMIITEAFSQGPNRQTGKVRSWPLNMYALSAVGVALGSFVVMVADLLKTLPPSSILDSSSTTRVSQLTNSRQNDLDSLVNALPQTGNTAPPTDAVRRALEQSGAVPASNGPAAPTTNTATTPKTGAPSATTPNAPASTSAPGSSTSTTPVPTPAPAPTPTPQPKCTTTQSGVTTCI